MARGATGAVRRRESRAADRAQRRQLVQARRRADHDAYTRAELDKPVLLAYEDWQLVRCEACGLEQGSGPYPCFVCGHDIATTTPLPHPTPITKGATP